MQRIVECGVLRALRARGRVCMLVAYYPPARTLLESDIIADTSPFGADAGRLAAWLRGDGAPPAQWIAGTHHRVLSVADFEAKAASQARRG